MRLRRTTMMLGLCLGATVFMYSASAASQDTASQNTISHDATEGLERNATYTPFAEFDYDVLLNISETGRQSSDMDVSTSYVWESARFGQFVLSTRTRYTAAKSGVGSVTAVDGVVLEPFLLSGSDFSNRAPAVKGLVPEAQSSVEFSWQIGNHVATATTHYANDVLDDYGSAFSQELTDLSLRQIDELIGQIAALDLSYGYNVKTGRNGNTLFSVGVRSTLDRRPVMQLNTGTASGAVLDANGNVAYGSIKYQF